MSRDGLMALLKSVILLNVMEEITANDNCVLHFSGDHNTPKSIKQALIINKYDQDRHWIAKIC